MRHADLARYERATDDGDVVDLLDDLTGLMPHRAVDATVPRPATRTTDRDTVTGRTAADQHLTDDPRSWRRAMAGVRARLAEDVAALEVEQRDPYGGDYWSTPDGAAGAAVDAAVLRTA